VPYPVKKLSKKVETCLTFYNAGYSIIFYIQSVCLFRKCNELFVRSCLREGKVDLNRCARTRGVDAVFNFIARCFERIDENKVAASYWFDMRFVPYCGVAIYGSVSPNCVMVP
jgi:hypothetical protein